MELIETVFNIFRFAFSEHSTECTALVAALAIILFFSFIWRILLSFCKVILLFTLGIIAIDSAANSLNSVDSQVMLGKTQNIIQHITQEVRQGLNSVEFQIRMKPEGVKAKDAGKDGV